MTLNGTKPGDSSGCWYRSIRAARSSSEMSSTNFSIKTDGTSRSGYRRRTRWGPRGNSSMSAGMLQSTGVTAEFRLLTTGSSFGKRRRRQRRSGFVNSIKQVNIGDSSERFILGFCWRSARSWLDKHDEWNTCLSWNSLQWSWLWASSWYETDVSKARLIGSEWQLTTSSLPFNEQNCLNLSENVQLAAFNQ